MEKWLKTGTLKRSTFRTKIRTTDLAAMEITVDQQGDNHEMQRPTEWPAQRSFRIIYKCCQQVALYTVVEVRSQKGYKQSFISNRSTIDSKCTLLAAQRWHITEMKFFVILWYCVNGNASTCTRETLQARAVLQDCPENNMLPCAPQEVVAGSKIG
ncbi:hypothetical protein AVEN_160370-1 [Araneus ventricosus]|uniref:Uncharacterized protein n=1 Tax=Araneus ventricosus TaxID=182803 RepID=A0A4Y2LXY6_ARAVE|nr:hypothetical protein AVEN_160370-1 [Araneus ventricosus]